MEFIAADGTQKTGEVWSPGPEARSVWVLLEDGAAVAVKLPFKDKPAAEVLHDWAHDAGRGRAAQVGRIEARYAPKLPEKLWREALSA
jgi:hypothetical protein